ncbi:protein of unknown function [Aminobacter niigataensis]|nr:protein of unknown function [Aminobacter niigataensis]
MVMLVPKKDHPADNHSTEQVNCGANAPHRVGIEMEALAADRGDEIAHFVDQSGKALDQPGIVRARLQLGDAIGDRKRTDATRRPLEGMGQPEALGQVSRGHGIANGKRLMDEHVEHFALDVSVADGLARQVFEVDGTAM